MVGLGGTGGVGGRSNSRLPTTLNARDQPPAEVSDQRVSGLTGAVHSTPATPPSEVNALDFDGGLITSQSPQV